jgi:hypothetical protein
MISPIERKLMRRRSATTAPITSDEPARSPQPKAAAIYAPKALEMIVIDGRKMPRYTALTSSLEALMVSKARFEESARSTPPA